MTLQFCRQIPRKFVRSLKCGGILAGRRCFASHYQPETIQIPCRSRAGLTLDLYSPNRKAFILYLPSGPALPGSSEHDDRIIHELLSSSNATVAKLNYRHENYPIPIHDVLTGYDWIRSNLATPKMGVCGSLVGGSLAIMLALTESSSGAVAVALNNPVIDWPEPEREALRQSLTLGAAAARDDWNALDDEVEEALITPKRPRRKKTVSSSWLEYKDTPSLTADAILTIRSTLFSSSDAYFDSFASPIFFFRTPGIDAPFLHWRPLSEHVDEEPPQPALKRKVRRIFPPVDRPFSLPSVRITTGERSCLQTQSEELLSRLIASEANNYLKPQKLTLAKYATSLEPHLQAKLLFAKEKASEKFSINYLSSSGLWGLVNEEWQQDVRATSEWFEQQLKV